MQDLSFPRMDGGCRHVVATLFEVMEFLNDQNKQSVTSGECLWIRRGNCQTAEKAIPGCPEKGCP